MPCLPDCTVCHNDDKGGFGTLRFITTKAGMPMSKGFARNLQSLAMGMLDGGDPSTLAPSIAFVKSMFPPPPAPPILDSDGDGIDDFTELSMGSDPNDFNPGASVCNGPVYGCGRIAKPGPVDNVAAVAAAAVGLVGISMLRRRR